MWRRGLRLISGACLVLAACSPSSGGSASGATSVPVTANNYKFDTTVTSYTAGKPYTFVVKNADTVAHDFLLMPRGETDENKKLGGVEDDDLQPGKTVTYTFTFPTAGQFEIACHVPGHYEAGMKLPITVS